MEDVLTHLDQVTPEWLTTVLRTKGYLPAGYVQSIAMQPGETSISLTAHLEITYSDDVPVTAPRRLFVKVSKPELPYPAYAQYAGREVAFYNQFVPVMAHRPLVQCYDAVYTPDDYRSHLLLEDISDTHFQVDYPYPPSQHLLDRIVASLATFHAAWWDHPALVATGGGYPTDMYGSSAIRQGAEHVAEFLAFVGDLVAPEWQQVYTAIHAATPQLSARMRSQQHFTLIHGDAHFGNIMLPRTQQHDVLLIDWDVYNVNIGASDLADLLMSQTWYVGPRSARQQQLVHHYHDQLLAHGVRNYIWDACWNDYRFAIILQLFTPIQQWTDDMWPGLWLGRLDRAMHAFHELGCMELLKP